MHEVSVYAQGDLCHEDTQDYDANLTYAQYLILQTHFRLHTKSVASAPKAPNILTPDPATTTRHHVTPAASQPAIEIPSELACFQPCLACDLALD